ncbi:MAG: N-acetyltransferase [Bacteroidetes bacterium]|nr:N-acetyltransferase [Bacteroidota bacterium]
MSILNDIEIRVTGPQDFRDVLEVESQAFGSDEEAGLTADLFHDETALPVLSLLAFHHGEAVGHILFTRAYLDGVLDCPLLYILAPLAVRPQYQGRGIGGQLIKRGIQLLKEMGTELIFVLGHKSYYPKFGFIPDARKQGFSAPYPIPEANAGAWMVMKLNKGAPKCPTGTIRCAESMNKEEYWME